MKNKKEHDDLLKFYNSKARQKLHAPAAFFAVMDGGKPRSTEWGYSEADVVAHLQNSNTYFRGIERLV